MRKIQFLALSLLLTIAPACGNKQDTSTTAAYISNRERIAINEIPQKEKAGVRIEEKKFKIIIKKAYFNENQLAELETFSSQADIVFTDDSTPKEKLIKEITDADALLTDGLTQDIIRHGKKLKWIQSYAAGIDDILFPELVSSDIVLTNCKIIQGPGIADHAFALLLHLTRRLNEAISLQKEEKWHMWYYREPVHWPIELNGRTALIVGMGGIGLQIAQRAHAFGMRVYGIDPKDIPYLFFIESIQKPDQLHKLLPHADVVFMTAPQTPETEYMFGYHEFNLMKSDAYFIALSRGKTFDTDALIKVIQEKKLAGAGLDVIDPYPLPKGHPLWKLGNVIITPHMSGQSEGSWNRRLSLLKENIQRFIDSRPLLNVVDKQKGY